MPPAIRFVLATVVLNAMGFGLIMPVTPKLVMALSGEDVSHATAIGGYLAFTFALFQFVCSPILGNLSDRFGRRPVLLASLFGFAVDFVLLALAPSLWWVFVARAVSGAFGATNAPAQSVIADLVPPDGRARYFGMISGAFGIGFVLGPLLGGLLGEFGYKVPFIAAALLAFATFVYGWMVLPETLAPQHRRRFEWRRANPVGSLMHVRALPGILPISIVYLLWQIASLVYPMTWTYFALGRYGWSEALVGLSLTGVGVMLAASQILVLPRIISRFGERRTAAIGMVGAMLAMLGYALAPSSWMAWALLPIIGVQAMVQPNLTAMMTRRASASTQGEVQGYAAAVMALGSLVSPLLYNPLLAWFTGGAESGIWARTLGPPPFIFWGAAFAVAALCTALALAILLRLRPAGDASGSDVREA